jgi:hypothetical protein
MFPFVVTGFKYPNSALSRSYNSGAGSQGTDFWQGQLQLSGEANLFEEMPLDLDEVR